MNKKKSNNYIYENNILRYESFINEFTPELFKEFDEKAKKLDLQSKINDLMNGKVVNKSENQAAWHPKYRKEKVDFINQVSEEKDEIFHSFFDSGEVRDRVNTLVERIKEKKPAVYKDDITIITIGIGGSFEGPKLLAEAFYPNKVLRRNLLFVTGSDPGEFSEKIDICNNDSTVFIVSSKSFKTDETIETLKQALEWSGSADNFIAITANPNEAKKYKFKQKNIIRIDNEIGGRYSIWSSIGEASSFGGIPIEEPDSKFFGSKFDQFILGGYECDKDLVSDKKYFDFIKFLSFSDIWLNNFKGKNIRTVLSYIWHYRSLPDYIQQLEMESLGKPANQNSEFQNTGQVIFGGYGPTAQHSYFQLLHQGTQDICADIIASQEDKKSLAYAQAITHSKLLSQGAQDLKNEERINGNTPTNLFLLNKENSYSLGYLIATWEHRTFITAIMLGINPFDQFGVNAGKIYTKKYLNNKD